MSSKQEIRYKVDYHERLDNDWDLLCVSHEYFDNKEDALAFAEKHKWKNKPFYCQPKVSEWEKVRVVTHQWEYRKNIKFPTPKGEK